MDAGNILYNFYCLLKVSEPYTLCVLNLNRKLKMISTKC